MNLTWLGFCNLPRNPLNLTWLCTTASWNLLRNILRNPAEPETSLPDLLGNLRIPSEPSPEPRWTWPGACTSAHQSYSGLKTPLAYAVGEKENCEKMFLNSIRITIYYDWLIFIYINEYECILRILGRNIVGIHPCHQFEHVLAEPGTPPWSRDRTRPFGPQPWLCNGYREKSKLTS